MNLTWKQQKVVDKTKVFVKKELSNAEGGHDWWHVYRVWKMALKISEKENANQFVVELSSLLHDIADPKFNDGNEDIGPFMAKEFLKKQDVGQDIADEVNYIIRNISFKNSFDDPDSSSLEFKIVQDADRLDAIGAIGIARTFNYGGFKNRMIYDPGHKPVKYNSKEEYKKSDSPTINHFYEKLLHLKDLMNTGTAKQIASERHQFILDYLDRFYKEWDGLK
jgi:uncharacterized protein